jgi:hypothetical protein
MNVHIGDRISENKFFSVGGKTYDVQQLLSKLCFFSKIKKNEKLHLENLSLVEDTWYNSLLRTFFYTDECKTKALAFIKETCDEALNMIEVFFASGEPFNREIGTMIVLTLNESQKGIIMYVETYKKDRLFVSDVESYLTILRARINNLEKLYPLPTTPPEPL